jgi:hypothetical protein
LRLRAVAIILAASISVIAAPITGDLDISGSVRIGANFADFTPLNIPPGSGTGVFNVEPTSTGTFNSLVIPVTEDDGTIKDLNDTIAPVGVAFSLPNFLVFAADPSITFELTRINPGIFGACAPGSSTCSVNQFNLIDTGGATVANFNVQGNIHSGTTVQTFQGSFSQSFAGQSIADILNTVATQGFIDSAFEANFVTSSAVVPEPGTMTLFGVGSALTAVVSFMRRKRA